MSIRFRLTLLYSAILALTLVVFSALLYIIQSQYTLAILKRDLAHNAQRLSVGIAARPRMPAERPGPRPEGRQPEPLNLESMRQEFQEMRIRDITRVLATDGTAINLPVNDENQALPLSTAALQAVQNGDPWSEIATVEGERMLVYNNPVVAEDRVIGIVQVARPLADRDRSLKALGGTLVAGSLFTTFVAFGIGWVLSGITLRPIHRITQTARTIGTERNFGRRVQYSGPNDEIGQLATTFNAMLSRLQDAYQQVARSLVMQRNFVADVSHELRTPLTTIRGNLALLRRQPPIPAEEREDVVTDMVDESDRLIRLVNGLLMLARADAGQQMKREHVQVKPLLEDVCRQARLLHPDRAILYLSPVDTTVFADRDALKQILLILLDNALKYSAGNVTVTISVQDRQLMISVRDAGPGMSPQMRDRIFDRFYRGDAARTPPGFGLGLPIAKVLVEAQGGTITVESQAERGSVFTIMLPRERIF